jgi:hypothetical protein
LHKHTGATSHTAQTVNGRIKAKKRLRRKIGDEDSEKEKRNKGE